MLISETQDDSFLVIGDVPNDEGYRCLVCRAVPDRVWSSVFGPDPKDVPAAIVSKVYPKEVVMPYRLCMKCHESNPTNWKIRLLLLEKLKVLASTF